MKMTTGAVELDMEVAIDKQKESFLKSLLNYLVSDK